MLVSTQGKRVGLHREGQRRHSVFWSRRTRRLDRDLCAVVREVTKEYNASQNFYKMHSRRPDLNSFLKLTNRTMVTFLETTPLSPYFSRRFVSVRVSARPFLVTVLCQENIMQFKENYFKCSK